MNVWTLLLTAALISTTTISGAEEAAPDAYADSRWMKKNFTRKMAKAREEGVAVDMNSLSSQLERTRCDAKLAPPSSASMAPTELYARKKSAVLIVGAIHNCGKCSKWHARGCASGFFVSPDGIMVTNHHVVDRDGDDIMGVMTVDGDVHPVVEILAVDAEADIAVLRVAGDDFPFLRLAPEAPIGSNIWIISNPDHQFHTFSKGMISGKQMSREKGERSKRLAATADYGGGSSGAPLLDERGDVVGMVSGVKVVYAPLKPKAEKVPAKQATMVIKTCVPAELIQDLFAESP